MKKNLIVFLVAFVIIATVLGVNCAYSSNKGHETKKTISVTAKMFEFNPKIITLRKGVVATLELTSTDVLHGFNCPALNIRSDMPVGKKVNVTVVPKSKGVFPFFCDVYCGSGHGDMTGNIVVK